MSQHQKIHLHTETIQSVIIHDKIFMTKAFTTRLTDGSILEPHGFQNTSPTNLLKPLTTMHKNKKKAFSSQPPLTATSSSAAVVMSSNPTT
jgi:hypothetical protein